MQKSIATALLTDTTLHDVFDRVVNARTVKLRDIGAPEARAETTRALDRLKGEGLIETSPAALEDFSTFYPTARGLFAHRQLKRIEKQILDL